jgi:prepilin-type processing-associated H-X9-DG protein/prepilin-type N-terminal cleavage/methylation domain-containing protein
MNHHTMGSLNRRAEFSRAFTLIELLVVIAVVGTLAALLLPVLSAARKKAQIPVCLNNARQLQMAWAHFADDNNGELMGNTDLENFLGRSMKGNWIYGAIGFDPRDSTLEDSTSLTRLVDPRYAQIGPYVQSAQVFKCPGDKSYFLKDGERFPRNRSYSMNEWIGNQMPNHYPSTYNTPVRIMRTRDSVRSEDFFVFIEEHEDGINDGQFRITQSQDGRFSSASDSLISIPASRHNNGATISFADGHVELHRWEDARTIYPVTRTPALQKSVPNSKDADWFKRHGAGYTP